MKIELRLEKHSTKLKQKLDKHNFMIEKNYFQDDEIYEANENKKIRPTPRNSKLLNTFELIESRRMSIDSKNEQDEENHITMDNTYIYDKKIPEDPFYSIENNHKAFVIFNK